MPWRFAFTGSKRPSLRVTWKFTNWFAIGAPPAWATLITSGAAKRRRGGAWRAGSADLRGLLVPEPETYALMLAGLAVVAFVARRRKS